ncbi:MAG: SusD/RagB family nutrient-binding outer membrane lipoprotein, partial [Polaribacter sp.]
RGNGLSQAFIGGGLSDHFSSLLIDFLRDHNDPRLPMLATKRINNEKGKAVEPGDKLYVGIKPGNFRWDHPGGANAASGIQPYYSANDAPFLHVSYSETELLLAEAAQRNWISGSAADYYKKGVEAGIKQLEMYGAPAASQTDIDSYLATNPLASGTEFEQIGTQLWVTYLFNSIEAYSNQRRTGYPVLIPITNPDSETGGVTPKRFYYPNDELQKNKANYLDALSRIGGSNDWLQPVWWDKN